MLEGAREIVNHLGRCSLEQRLAPLALLVMRVAGIVAFVEGIALDPEPAPVRRQAPSTAHVLEGEEVAVDMGDSEVEEDPQVAPVGLLEQPPERRLPAEGRIDAARIDGVVAMGGAGDDD